MANKLTADNNNQIRFVLIFMLAVIFMSGCATVTKNTIHSDQTSTIFYIQTNEESKHYKNNKTPWNVTAVISSKQTKPKIFFYNFIISSNKKFIITDINYKYGTYGKWRIIKKQTYLNVAPNTHLDDKSDINLINNKTIMEEMIKNFPITIKKSGEPHNQLVQLTLTDAMGKKHYVNLVFGVQKCLSKNENEFLCF